jgi:hypothetical protein
MSEPLRQAELILEKLAHDVEASVHAFYRGDVRQHTARVKSSTFVSAAREALAPFLGAGSTSAPSAPAADMSALAADEVAALTRCVMGWLPMGPPSTASPQLRCVPGAREMLPTWGEREKARLSLKRAAG